MFYHKINRQRSSPENSKNKNKINFRYLEETSLLIVLSQLFIMNRAVV